MISPNDSENRQEKSPDYRLVLSADDEAQERPAQQSAPDAFLAADAQGLGPDEPVIDVADDPWYR
jgi:hypothetical protein